MNMDKKEARAWRDIWSAGHGVTSIRDVPPVAQLVDELARDFDAAVARVEQWTRRSSPRALGAKDAAMSAAG
jgi:nitronate monooxygenase